MKKPIQSSLEANDLETVASLVKQDRKVLSQLVRMAYDKETLIGWRSIKAIGLAAKALVQTDEAFLRETIRKLLWSLSDESGGIGWSAPEILGEIVSADPEKFQDVIPLVAGVYTIEEKIFRPGVMYALQRISKVAPLLILRHKDLIFKALSDDNVLVRFYGLEALSFIKGFLGNSDKEAVANALAKLLYDQSETWIYVNNDFINIQIKEAARKYLENEGFDL